jgi:hypothetical protein
MALKDILAEALKAVDEAEIPSELREIAFGKAIDLVAGTASPKSRIDPQVKVQPQGQLAGDASGPMQRIANKLKLDSEVVSHVYYIDPEGKNLEVVISSSRLPAGFAPAIKELALLVAAGRQAAGIDAEWTSADEIRKVCEHFKRYDSANFAAHIQQMERVFSVRGTPRKREVRMTSPAWEEATALITRLTSSG